jgi:hypothetical protein
MQANLHGKKPTQVAPLLIAELRILNLITHLITQLRILNLIT